LSGLPTGRYSLTALKPAHVTTYYGSRRAGSGPGVPLALTEGTSIDSIVLRMPRGAVISGRVVDEFGQPFPNASVRIMQFQTVDGRRNLRPSGGLLSNTQTDDRGQYRVFGLTPGQYVVMVTPPRSGRGEVRQLSSADVDSALADVSRANTPSPASGSGASGSAPTPFGGRAVGFSPVYYPGSTAVGSAAEVTVSSGQVLEGIDVTVPLVPTARLEGIITGPDGRPVGGVTALLLPDNGNEISFGATNVIRTQPDGTWSTTNVAPGRYVLTARSSSGGTENVTEFAGGAMFISRQDAPARADASASGPPPKPLWAQAFVDVNGEDLSGLALTLREGMTVTGRVLFEGTRPPPADVSGIRIGISPAENTGISLGAPGDTLKPDGTVALDGVTPGSYRLNARVPPDGFSANSAWRLKSAVLDGQDTLDTQLTVQPGENVDGLVLTFTDRMSELSGTVLDPAGAPVSDLTILVFPTESAFWSATARRMPRPQQPGSDGRFTFPGLPSGEYFLAAVTEVEPESWGNPAFMEQVAAAAIRITLGEGENKVQDLRIGGGG
jgi:protocatechuate 3,4-dioxygenase beta subunit